MLASGSVDFVLDGRHYTCYNRRIHALKIVAEAMERLRWATFLECNEKQHDSVNIITIATTIDQFRNDIHDTT